jgi:hypothetical protein
MIYNNVEIKSKNEPNKLKLFEIFIYFKSEKNQNFPLIKPLLIY